MHVPASMIVFLLWVSLICCCFSTLRKDLFWVRLRYVAKLQFSAVCCLMKLRLQLCVHPPRQRPNKAVWSCLQVQACVYVRQGTYSFSLSTQAHVGGPLAFNLVKAASQQPHAGCVLLSDIEYLNACMGAGVPGTGKGLLGSAARRGRRLWRG